MVDQDDGTPVGIAAECGLTELQVRALADHVAAGTDLEAASKAIGYTGCLDKLTENVKTDCFLQLVAERRQFHIRGTIVPHAYRQLSDIMSSASTPPATRLSAVKLALEIGGELPGKTDARTSPKQAEEPPKSLPSHVETLKRQAADAARRIIDANPEKSSELTEIPGIKPHRRMGD